MNKRTQQTIDLITGDSLNSTEDQEQRTIKPGDIFYTSWGYDQTNYDYLMILEISPSKKTCLCSMVHCDHVGERGHCHIQKPKREIYGDIFRMKIELPTCLTGSEVMLRGSYPFCINGSKEHLRLDTFWKWDGKRQFYETDTQFGH